MTLKRLLNWLFPVLDIKRPDGTVYLRRRTLFKFAGYKLMLHHIRLPDETRHIHDHPWWFLTFILWGGYTEETFNGEKDCKPFRLYFRGVQFSHIITEVPDAGAWTLVLRGRRIREWGFFTECGWKHWPEYIHRYNNGLPICEDNPVENTTDN